MPRLRGPACMFSFPQAQETQREGSTLGRPKSDEPRGYEASKDLPQLVLVSGSDFRAVLAAPWDSPVDEG